jgi:hypothetical protein
VFDAVADAPARDIGKATDDVVPLLIAYRSTENNVGADGELPRTLADTRYGNSVDSTITAPKRKESAKEALERDDIGNVLS